MQKNLSDNLDQWNKISNYSKWIFNTYKKYVNKRVLDIGAGVGTMTQYYLNDCEMAVATDIFQDQIDAMNRRFQYYPDFNAILFDILIDDITVLQDKKFDTIICINVMEHLEDDKKALLKMKDIIQENGKIIIMVPAFQLLYSYLDRNVSHYRRYNRGELSELAKECGLEILLNKYFNFFGIIPYYLKGKFTRDRGGSFSTDLNDTNSSLYNMASVILEPFEKVINPPAGISEIIVLKKSNK